MRGGVQGRRQDVRAGDTRPRPRQRQLQMRPGSRGRAAPPYAAITAGYPHKRHWNTVTLDGSVLEDEPLDLIDHSYEPVVARRAGPNGTC